LHLADLSVSGHTHGGKGAFSPLKSDKSRAKLQGMPIAAQILFNALLSRVIATHFKALQ
jgi:predicted MPP superfamily phosphohydrolase